MKLLLDTNVCIDVLRGHAKVIVRFAAHQPEDFILTTVTEFELLQGVERGAPERRSEGYKKVRRFLSLLKIVSFESIHAAEAARINAALLSRGTPIGIADVFIGATAMTLGVPVVTSNGADFKRIKGLKVLDWRR